EFLKQTAKEYGADLVGITKINKDHFYSHRGRKTENYGDPINCVHSYAIVFAVEMEKDKIDLAPAIEESIETSRIYVKISIVGMILSYYLRRLGYESRNHMDANYLLPLPSLAEEAGLGELGRIGFLVTKKFGPRVRLGAVTTNLELIADEKQDFGIREFCETCHLCEKACLGHAIPSDASIENAGRHYWQIEGEKCYEVWKRIGTDCGVCMKVCPFSVPENGKK
ncbi:MAG: 4Fe-4S dicluster domain-containing protein, partial [Candidatus Marinimicrobia bacterium]|nr:4Fe-4S dicluster domain-containing protein [Candidatus Neomarinimicrobiota bacterium]